MNFLEEIHIENGFNNLLFVEEIEFQYSDFRRCVMLCLDGCPCKLSVLLEHVEQ